MDISQSSSFVQSMTYNPSGDDYESFPKTENPVWIMGQHYSALYDMDDIKNDMLSRLWFTYRKGFQPIGGVGPTFDTGWGCMLRCGQMMLAQSLICRHLGRSWRWQPEKYDPKYYEILRMFIDKKNCSYSIHQIASMGVSEGKGVGMWFGPNTVAQVLRKLAVYEKWSNMVFHVAMDNTVVISDINQLCCPVTSQTCSNGVHPPPRPSASCSCPPAPGSVKVTQSEQQSSVKVTPEVRAQPAAHAQGACSSSWGDSGGWRPLLLIIPLRLGLTELNPLYVDSLKMCFTFPQSVGVIGGKPNHAHYFVGYVDDELIFLDPHVTQQVADVTAGDVTDDSYHCTFACRTSFDQIDPSIALGFFCNSEADFHDLCDRVRGLAEHGSRAAMFELQTHRPPHWPPFEPYSLENEAAAKPVVEYDVVEERHFDSDDDFELL